VKVIWVRAYLLPSSGLRPTSLCIFLALSQRKD